MGRMAVAHYVEGHRPRGLTGIHEQPGPGSIGNPPESSEVCAIPSFVLGDHDVFAALSGRQVRGDYSGGGAHGRDDRDLLMMRSDDLRENGSGVFPCPFRFGPVKSTG